MRARKALTFCLAVIFLASSARAQTGGSFEVRQSIVASGGQNSTGGNVSLDGTIGQPLAGNGSSGGVFDLRGGFWSAETAPNPAGVIQFAQSNFSAGEAAGTATVTVARAGGSAGAASVQYATADGTATGGASCGAGVDYVVTSGTLNWADGDASGKTFSVTVCDDALFENDETVNLTLSNAAGAALGAQASAVLTITNDDGQPPGPHAGDVLISEFRLRGPDPDGAGPLDGARDEFIELYNNTDSAIRVGDPDSRGWALAASDGTIVCVIPNGTVIRARGHYLITNNSNPGGYSLDAYAAPDLTYTADIPDDTGLALFPTASVVDLAGAAPLDAVGFQTVSDARFREGAGLPPLGAHDGQYSFVRKMTTGLPQDTGDNAQDFVLVSAAGGSLGGVPTQLGAPGPENLSSPVNRGAHVKSSLVAPCVTSSDPPNRVRDVSPYADALSGTGSYAPGTLLIRRRFTNNTGQALTHLRYRVVDITAGAGGGGVADVRLVTSGDQQAFAGPCGQVEPKGLALEQPPAQTSGGGLNSTAGAGAVTLSDALAPGASIDLNFLLGVAQTGSFRFLVIVEALPAPDAPPPGVSIKGRQ